MKKNVGIFIFDDAEVLDFTGPFEVFSVASQLHDHALFNVFTVADKNVIVKAVNGLQIKPDYSLDDYPSIDILILSGGQGTRNLITDALMMEKIKKLISFSSLTLSICSAARLLAVCHLLTGRPFCTHSQVYEHIMQLSPDAIAMNDKRFVQTTDRIYTSGGIAAGIDLSFHIVEKLHGAHVARAVADYMEYPLHHLTSASL